jgi:hypothetical protein
MKVKDITEALAGKDPDAEVLIGNYGDELENPIFHTPCVPTTFDRIHGSSQIEALRDVEANTVIIFLNEPVG